MEKEIREGISRTTYKEGYNGTSLDQRQTVKRLLDPLVNNKELLHTLTEPHITSALRKHFRLTTTFYNKHNEEVLKMRSIGKTDLYQQCNALENAIPKGMYIPTTQKEETIAKIKGTLSKYGSENQYIEINNGDTNVQDFKIELEFIK